MTDEMLSVMEIVRRTGCTHGQVRTFTDRDTVKEALGAVDQGGKRGWLWPASCVDRLGNWMAAVKEGRVLPANIDAWIREGSLDPSPSTALSLSPSHKPDVAAITAEGFDKMDAGVAALQIIAASMQSKERDRLLTCEQVRECYVPTKSDRWLKENLPRIRLGRDTFFRETDVIAWVKRLEVK